MERFLPKKVSTVAIIPVFLIMSVGSILLGLRDKIADAENTARSD